MPKKLGGKLFFNSQIAFALFFCSLFMAGCSTPLDHLTQMDGELAQLHIEYAFNLAKTSNVGKLIIRAVPPSQQLAVQEYGINIDDGETIKILKRSNSEIILDKGVHKLKMFSIPLQGNIFYADVFGKPSLKEIDIQEGKTICYQYEGPFWIMTEGSLKEVKV